MNLQTFKIYKGISFTISTENIVISSPLKVTLSFNNTKITVEAAAAVALFSCYEDMKEHFGRMIYMGEIDFIIHKAADTCTNQYWVCLTVIKTCDNDIISRQFEIRFYDFGNGGGISIPCDRGIIHFLYSRRHLIRNAVNHWQNKMDQIEQDNATEEHTNHTSLMAECKWSLLYAVPYGGFIPEEYLQVMPTGVRHYLLTWKDDNLPYIPVSTDYGNPDNTTDTDENF
jgi:hypothetical protein